MNLSLHSQDDQWILSSTCQHCTVAKPKRDWALGDVATRVAANVAKQHMLEGKQAVRSSPQIVKQWLINIYRTAANIWSVVLTGSVAIMHVQTVNFKHTNEIPINYLKGLISQTV